MSSSHDAWSTSTPALTDSPPPNSTFRNITEYDFTKIQDVRDYVSGHNTRTQKWEVQRLAGAITNYIYRVTDSNARDERRRSFVIKHATKHFQIDHTQAINPNRMDYEARVLTMLSPVHCSTLGDSMGLIMDNTHAHAATPDFYNGEAKILFLEDGGDRNLKDAYSELSTDDIREIGTALGRWLADLHMNTPKTHVCGTVSAPHHNNNRTSMDIYRYSYMNLPAVLMEFGHDGDLGCKIRDRYGSRIEMDDECVCHGDFWPGNVTILSSHADKGPFCLTIVDWEMVRIGNSATDLGQFAAEAFLLDTLQGEKGLRVAFLQAYFATRTIDWGSNVIIYPWIRRIAVHFAVHIAFWCTRELHWAKQHTQALIDMAVIVLRNLTGDTPDVKQWKVFDGMVNLEA